MKQNEKGLSILEQVMVYPVLLTMILGAIDVNTLLQAYSALQSGVHASLRCVYTTDGKCVSTAADPRTRFYDYYQVDRTQQFVSDTYNFSGTTSWLDIPNYTASNFQARILQQVQFDSAQATFSAARRYFNAQRTADYFLRTATYPYVSGDPLDPTLSYRGAAQNQPATPYGSYPVAGTVGLGNVDLSVSPATAGNPPTALSGYLPAPAGNQRPFYSSSRERDANDPSHSAVWTQRANANTYPMVIHITGTKSGTNTFSSGNVGIELLKYNSNNQLVDTSSLGGRSFGRQDINDTDPRANFVIRGVPSNWRSQSVNNSGYTELDIHNATLQVEYGFRYRIRFTLQHSAGGVVEWHGGSIRVYLPQETPKTEVITCTNLLRYCDTSAQCQTPVPQNSQDIFQDFTLLNSGPPVSVGPQIQLGNTCQNATANFASLLQAQGINECVQNFEFNANTSGCGTSAQTLACPAIGTVGSQGTQANYGVAQLANAQGFIVGSTEAALICPPLVPQVNGLPAPTNVRWTEALVSVPPQHVQPNGVTQINWTKQNCNTQLQFPAGSLLGNYPKLSFVNSLASQQPYYTGAVDPAALKANPQSGYACPEIGLSSQGVDVLPHQVSNGNQNSLFYGERTMPGCAWEQALQNDALQHNLMPANAFFRANQPQLGVSKYISAQIPDICVDPSPEILWSEPTGRTLIPGGPYPDGQIPAQCQQGNVACSPEFVGFGPGSPAQTTYDFKTASEHFGFNEIQASYPRAKWNCADEDCVEMQVTDDGTHFTSTASVTVPVRLFFGKTTKIEYTQRERKEVLLAR
jgi:hypothetical protein